MQQEADKPQPSMSQHPADVAPKQAQESADHIISESEQFKATVAPQPGMIHNFDLSKLNQYLKDFIDNDDDFFHLTCHIDPNLHAKIEKRKFVDLEKLLPSNKFNQ